MLIDVLAREMRRVVITKRMELDACDHLRQGMAESVRRNEPEVTCGRCLKDQVLFSGKTRARQIYSNKIS
jgi:hypothetical protein